MIYRYSRNEIRNKNLFNVADCKIYWQKSGDYLCVKVDRFAKRKEKTEQKYTVRLIKHLKMCIHLNELLKNEQFISMIFLVIGNVI